MKKDQLRSLLKQPIENVEQQPGCLNEYQLASYLDGGLSERDHGCFETHLADCAYCIERVGILGRAGESENNIPVPDSAQNWWRTAPQWAAAAIVVVAVGVGIQLNSPYQSIQPVDVHETRNIAPATQGPSFLSPREGMTITPDFEVFNWTAVPDSLYYQLRIVSDDGDLLWQERVNGTQWELPAGLMLSPDTEYFVRVDAYVAEAKTLNSDYLLFMIGDRQ